MATFTFNGERKCPLCGHLFSSALQKVEYEPVIVVICPKCNRVLWRPGLDDKADLFAYDEDADKGGI